MVIKKMADAIPFLKWAGGKRWLTSGHPSFLPTSYGRYIEPFLGSAAMFFSLRPQFATLNDVNRDLIETYSAIKEDWQRVAIELAHHHANHCRDYYYAMRQRKPRLKHKRAAKFIYLNRTCWNGLYRVNCKGEFNVPIGTKSNVVLATDDFEMISKLLQGCELVAQDFETVIENAIEGDFIFADPPYTVKHNLNGFIKYNERLFSWDDQIRLHKALIRAKRRGVAILLTNANHRSIRDLYREEFQMDAARRYSVIAGKSAARKSCSELIIRG